MLGQADTSGSDYGAAAVVLLVIGVGLYFLPTIIAMSRKVPNAGSVFVINLFLGWSLIGWVVALSMASRSVPAVHSQNAYMQPASSGAPPARPGGGATRQGSDTTYTHTGVRYLFGYTMDPPAYAIWDRQQPGPPVERFPYSEHGKAEGLGRYRALEPNAADVNPGGSSTPPMPG